VQAGALFPRAFVVTERLHHARSRETLRLWLDVCCCCFLPVNEKLILLWAAANHRRREDSFLEFAGVYPLAGIAFAACPHRSGKSRRVFGVPPPESQSKVIVLVVEDEPLQGMHAVDIVEAAGFEAIEAGNANHVVRILELRNDVRVAEACSCESPHRIDEVATTLRRMAA
jgi:hypothetical protein